MAQPCFTQAQVKYAYCRIIYIMLNYFIALKYKSKPKYFVRISFNITFLPEFPKNYSINQYLLYFYNLYGHD